MTTIKLSDTLAVDAVEYASRANAILGIRDSGKTYTGTLIAEQLFDAGIPFFAFDPIGRWRFLRLAGRGPGFKVVVAGGAAPDLPLTAEGAAKLVRAALQSGISLVIDLYDVKLSKADWRLIVRRSIETILYEGEGHGLRHVFLEEASEFIPQRVRDGNTYAAVEKLARMGGNVGVGVTLINQRAEEVNKAVLELCDNLLLHRQRGKNSLLSLGKWLNAANVKPPKEITDSIADLPTGECWAWFKELGAPRRIKIAQKRSFDPNRRDMARFKGVMVKTQGADVSEFVARMKAALAGKPVEKPMLVRGGYTGPPGPKPALPTTGSGVKRKEGEVDEKEARALRDDNASLKAEVTALKGTVAELRRFIEEHQPMSSGDAEVPPLQPGAMAPVPVADIDAIFAELKRRAERDPMIIALLARTPEIAVSVERKVIRMNSETQPGFLAMLIAQGYFDQPVASATVKAELKRRGRSVHDANLSRDLTKLGEQGFLTREDSGWKAAPGMKVNIEEAA